MTATPPDIPTLPSRPLASRPLASRPLASRPLPGHRLLGVGGSEFPAVLDALVAARGSRTEVVLLVVEGDRPSPDAVGTMVALFAADAACPTDVAYADEDWLDAEGNRTDPFHKPRWSPDRLRAQMYLSGLVAYRTSLWTDALPDIDPSLTVHEQLHVLALWATARTPLVAHLPVIGCHRRVAEAVGAGDSQWLSRSFRSAGITASARRGPNGYLWHPDPAPDVLVSVVIPTGGGERVVGGRRLLLVENALRSILDRSTHLRYEIVLVIDRNTDEALADRLVSLDPDRIRWVRDERPFNFAAAVNQGVTAAGGDVLVLLNDDTEVVTPDWIERLAALALAPGAGAVGVRLNYGDGRIQHAGITGRYGSGDHRYRGYPVNHRGHGDELTLTHNVLAVTAACLAISRTAWADVGGMDEAFPLNFNDLDLCLRLHSLGHRNVQDNNTVLDHLETSSRPAGSESWEDERLRARWDSILRDDPYDNPNLVQMGFTPLAPPAALDRLRELTRSQPPPARFANQAERLRFRA